MDEIKYGYVLRVLYYYVMYECVTDSLQMIYSKFNGSAEDSHYMERRKSCTRDILDNSCA